MFIKIGDTIINSDNILRVMKVTGQRVDFEMNGVEEGYVFSFSYTFNDPRYSEALAAYDWFCKAAIRFDDTATEPAATEPAGAREAGERYEVRSANSSSATWDVWDTVKDELVIHTGHDYKLAEENAQRMNTRNKENPTRYHPVQRANSQWYVRDAHAENFLYPGSNGYSFEDMAQNECDRLNVAAPQPATDGAGDGDSDSGATGERDWHYDKTWIGSDAYLYSLTDGVKKLEFLDANLALDVVDIFREYENETAALRAELAAARERIAELTGELSEKGREVDTMQDSIDDLNHMVDLARAERNSVKAQLAECQHAHELARTQRDAATELYSGKHGRIEELKRELEVSRDARKALEKVIQTAATYLAETNSSDENVGRAYNVLSGFASAD